MNEDIKREIEQLWFESEKYFSSALNEKSKIPKSDLNLTIDIIMDKIKDEEELRKKQNLFYSIARFKSSAVILCSIDENLKSDRWHIYNKIKNLDEVPKIKKEIKENLNNIIHFLLRDLSAHSEPERLARDKFKIPFDAMYDVYLNLGFESIFESMNYVRKSIMNEIHSITN